MKRLRERLAVRLICSALIALMALPLAAHPVLQLTVTSHKRPAAGMTSAGKPVQPSDETFALRVTLGHQYLITEEKGTRTIYDFERLRIFRIALASATFTDDSLYSDIGFRAMEFQNRLMLGSALQAGKVAANPMEPVLTEQLFSLSNPKGNTPIEQRHAGGNSEFFSGQHRLVSVSEKTQELPPAYRAEYWRFLRYYAGGHPQVYASLKALNGVPQKITFTLTNMGTETRDIVLDAITSVADAPYSLEGLTRAAPDGEPYNTLTLLGADAAAKLVERSETTIKVRDAAIAQGQVLDAELSNMALLIMNGDGASLAPWLAQHRDAILKDDAARSLSANLQPRDEAGVQSALQVLTELKKQPGNSAYMLDVFAGNILLPRDGKAGSEHLLAALKANPYLLGAWKDLGGYYYQTYRMDKAWACWDAARRVNPQHSMLLRITEIEKQLRTTFPEFF